MADRLMGAVSLCRKAGRLRMGMDLVCEEVQKGGVRLVLVAVYIYSSVEGHLDCFQFLAITNKTGTCRTMCKH